MSEDQRQDRTAIDLQDHCLLLARDGTIRPGLKTEFFRRAGTDPALEHGRLLTLHPARSPRDVHYPLWEMHPAGDELLVLASGALSVELRDGRATRMTALPAQAAFIVPAGVWHRLVVREPSLLMAITPGYGTVHRNE
jgi:mannose-6-phosphate isomerase-like protein (cupin superfamily)